MKRVAVLAVLLSLPVSFACNGESDDDSTDDGVAGSGSTAADPATTTGPSGSTGSPPAGSTSGGSSDGSTGPGDSTGADSSGGAAGPTWDNFAAAFFETYCWECHGPGDMLRDYSMLSAVMAESNTIRCGTAPASDPAPDCAGEPPAEQFPIGMNLPSDDERATLVEWIDAGLP